MIISSGGTDTMYYTVTDTQGTMYKLLDSTGTTVASYNYDPFGLMRTNHLYASRLCRHIQ
jgi:uncharacterized protein RhaS with RHS repeats